MPAPAKRDDDAVSEKKHPPTKGGTKPADPKARPSGDSPKPHGDPLRHVIEEK
jgi:hypothetical protein